MIKNFTYLTTGHVLRESIKRCGVRIRKTCTRCSEFNDHSCPMRRKLCEFGQDDAWKEELNK